MLFFVSISIFTNSYSTCKQDSIYRDLYAFLVEKNVIPKDVTIPEFGSENYDTYLYVSDVLHDDFPNKPDLTSKFGVYRFNYNGCEDCGFYVLLIHKDSYKVFNQNSLPLIIEELLQIKRKDPEIIPYDLFCNYLSELIKVNYGINTSSIVIMHKIGKIKYYMSR